MTKAEALKLSRRARAEYGIFRISATYVEIACPLDADRNTYVDAPPAHRITVWHKPWEKVTAKMIDAAFVAHFCADEDERCEAIT